LKPLRIMMSAAASPAAVSILGHLRKLGHTVTGLDSSAEAAPLGRAFCDVFHVSPLAESPRYLPFLIERLSEVDLFLPFIDEELVAIAGGWHSIPPPLASRIALSPPEVVLTCVDKCSFQEACELAGLPIAPTPVGVPAFFKPRYGRGSKGVVAVHDEMIFALMRERDGVMQRFIEGQEYTVDAIFGADSRLLATVPRKRIRAAGVSTIGEVIPDPALHALAERLGRRWPFRYAINFQVIRDLAGRDWLIELNPRLSGSAIFSAHAGCDPIAATIALSQGQSWSAQPRPLRVWRYWQEFTQEPPV
jgi:carbamoyl-phosphate synthase large subunit